MKTSVNAIVLGVVALGLMTLDYSPRAPGGLEFLPEAAALVGMPLSPVSFAGAARRTTRRAVVVSSSAVVASQQQAAAVQQQQAAAVPQQAPSAATGSVAIGSVVTALPAGCTPTTISGVQYQHCAGAYYRAAFQGNNLVYVVTQP